jgi:hypothetical protein
MAGAAMDAEDTDGQQGFARAVAAVRAGASVDEQARWLYGELTDEERLWILDGDTPFWSGLADMMSGGFNEHTFVHGEIARLGIPGLRFCDGPRGRPALGAENPSGRMRSPCRHRRSTCRSSTGTRPRSPTGGCTVSV